MNTSKIHEATLHTAFCLLYCLIEKVWSIDRQQTLHWHYACNQTYTTAWTEQRSCDFEVVLFICKYKQVALQQQSLFVFVDCSRQAGRIIRMQCFLQIVIKFMDCSKFLCLHLQMHVAKEFQILFKIFQL